MSDEFIKRAKSISEHYFRSINFTPAVKHYKPAGDDMTSEGGAGGRTIQTPCGVSRVARRRVLAQRHLLLEHGTDARRGEADRRQDERGGACTGDDAGREERSGNTDLRGELPALSVGERATAGAAVIDVGTAPLEDLLLGRHTAGLYFA